MEDYDSSGLFIGRLFQPPMLRLQGKALHVQAAMEPSTILWENLDSTDTIRWIRRIITFLVSISLLLFSFAVLYYAQQSRMVRVSEIEFAVIPRLYRYLRTRYLYARE